VLTDETGKVIGYGRGGFRATDLGERQEDHGKHVRWWLAAFTGAKPASTTAYVLLDDRKACPLGTPNKILPPLTLKIVAEHPIDLPPGGFAGITQSQDGGGEMTISGWGYLQPKAGASTLMLDTNLPIKSFTLAGGQRPDVVEAIHDPGLQNSGFQIVLNLDQSVPRPKKITLCLWSDDSFYGRRLVQNSDHAEYCPS
jgi:hypothetical protein